MAGVWVVEGRAEVVEALGVAGASSALVDCKGAGALFRACENGHEACARLLLDRDAKVDLADQVEAERASVADRTGAKRLWLVGAAVAAVAACHARVSTPVPTGSVSSRRQAACRQATSSCR